MAFTTSITTGTPEYQEYLKKQKQHEEYKAKHDNLISQGYANQISTNQAETDRLNKQFGITPSGWYRYDTPETSGETNFNGYIYNTDGGGALLRNLDKLLIQEVGLPVIIADDPTTCVIRGMGQALSFLDNSAYDSLFVH